MLEGHFGCIQQDSFTCSFFGGSHYWVGQPHKRSSLQALRLFYRRREKSSLEDMATEVWRWHFPQENLYEFVRMYGSKALGFWCDDGPCWSWSWKSATETSMLRMLCKSSCTNFGSAGPHSKAKQHDKYGKTSPSQHIYIYTTGVFFLDPFNYCFLAWLHTISTY